MPVVDAPSSLSTFSVLVMPYGLLGTPGNLEQRKRKGMNGLIISNANFAGLVGDADAGVTCDVVSHGTLLINHI